MKKETPSTRKGKIAGLPAGIREQVCQKILDGETGSKILPWLNGLAEVKKVLGERFDGVRISDENLTQWRKGGYQDWLSEQKQVRDLRAKSELALAIAKASGGNLSEGAAAIAGGKLLELMEAANGENINDLVDAATAIRGGDIELKKLAVKERDGERADRKLDLEENRYRLAFCTDFLKWWGDKRAADGAAANSGRQGELTP